MPDTTHYEKQLNLLIALDEARDTLDDDVDPMSTFDAIVYLLKREFEADACALLLTENATGTDEIVAVSEIDEDDARTVCREAMTFEKAQPIKSESWQHTLALRIHIDREKEAIGSFFLARQNTPFIDSDIALITLAETGIDSAVMQARTIWKLAERNRRLEAIHEIDALRDDAPTEQSLLNACTGILMRHFKADLCMILSSHIDTGEMSIQGLIDRRELSADVLNQIKKRATKIRKIKLIDSPDAVDNLNLMVCPVAVSGAHFGAIIIGREKKYMQPDIRLMEAIVGQMDTAIARSRVDQQLVQRTRELEAIYQIDHIRDQDSDFDLMMQQVLMVLCEAVTSETGFLMLYNADKEDPLEIRATTRENVLSNPDYLSTIRRVSKEALDRGEVLSYADVSDRVQSIIAIPLILNAKIIGVFGALNSEHNHGFSAEDRRMLEAITSQVDTAVFERLERRRMRKVLSRSVDPRVLDALLQKADDSLLTGERVILSVLFADLRGSTEWAERIDPEELVATLNMFLGKMTEVIFKHNGTLDKFVGDEVIALFGSPMPMKNHALYAAQAALEMQKVHTELIAEKAEKGLELPTMGIGISSGEVIAGEFGPPIRTDFTAMGRVMNLGARLCSAAPGGEVIISETTREMLEDRIEVADRDPIMPKGINRHVPIYQLLKVK